jgi:hypothetical protein
MSIISCTPNVPQASEIADKTAKTLEPQLNKLHIPWWINAAAFVGAISSLVSAIVAVYTLFE